MGLFKIFTRRSSKAKLRVNDVQPRLEPSSQENGDTRQPEPDVPVTSIAPQQEPDLAPHTTDLQEQPETWDSASAPAPFVPRHPSLVVEERPRTGVSIRSLSRDWSQFPTRPKREARKPPVSFKKPSSLASMSNAYQNTAHPGDSESDINSLVRLRRANGSRSSLGSIKSKDILDAQEQIRPTDFRSRLQATGARDYGEDVADRNITRHRDGNLSPTPDPRQMGNRTKSLSSTSMFPRVITSRDLHQPTSGPPLKEESASEPAELYSFSNRNKRRLSLNTYVPTGMVHPVSSESMATSPKLADDIAARDFAPSASDSGKDTANRPVNLSPTTNNFSRPRSPQTLQLVTTRGNIHTSHMGHVADGRIAEVLASDNATSSEVSNSQRMSNQSLRHASPPRSPGRQSYQTLRSSLASSIPSRYPSTDLTPLAYPIAKQTEAHTDDPNVAYGEAETTVGRAQSSFSHRHSRSNDSEDQIRYHRSQSLGFLSSPLEADEQSTIQSGSIRNWSLSETSRSDTTGHSNVFSAASGRPHSRHTANTSLDSKSAESFMTANNGQHGSDWSPVTNRSKNFNIDDYVSSDDDSFTTPEKKARPTAEGEEELLFKAGYGMMGVALPGLEALGEEDEYSDVPAQNNRNDSVSSNGSVAVASSPKDNRIRYGTGHDISPTLRHVRSDPEELYMGTFGRLLMRGIQRSSAANVWDAKEGDTNPAEHLDESYTPSASSTDSDDHGDMRSTVGSLGGFRQQRSESSFSVYSTTGGGTVTTTITGGAKAVDWDTYDDMRAPRRGLKRLSALGTLYGRSMGTFASADRRPSTASDGALRGETRASDIIRRRKEDKSRKRSDGGGLRIIREKRLTETFGRPGNDGIEMLREHLQDDDEMWESSR